MVKDAEDYNRYDLRYRIDEFEQKCYNNLSMTGVYGLYAWLYIIGLVALFVIPVNVSQDVLPFEFMITESGFGGSGGGEQLADNYVIGLLWGVIASFGAGHLAYLMWYPRNFEPIEVTVRYEEGFNWLLAMLGIGTVVVIPISLLLGWGWLTVISMIVMVFGVVATDRLMITDEVEFYKEMYEEDTSISNRSITHEHLPDKLYPFNTERRGRLYRSLTISIVASGFLIISTSLIYQVVFMTMVLLTPAKIYVYLKERDDMEKVSIS